MKLALVFESFFLASLVFFAKAISESISRSNEPVLMLVIELSGSDKLIFWANFFLYFFGVDIEKLLDELLDEFVITSESAW